MNLLVVLSPVPAGLFFVFSKVIHKVIHKIRGTYAYRTKKDCFYEVRNLPEPGKTVKPSFFVPGCDQADFSPRSGRGVDLVLLVQSRAASLRFILPASPKGWRDD